MSEKRFTVIDREEPRGQSVAENGIPCTARHCATNLNRLFTLAELLEEENEQLQLEMSRLYHYFKDYFSDKRNWDSDKFGELWCIVKSNDVFYPKKKNVEITKCWNCKHFVIMGGFNYACNKNRPYLSDINCDDSEQERGDSE